MGWVGKDSEGASGGLWTVWDASKLKMIYVQISAFCITIVLEEIFAGRSFTFTNVYGPNDDARRGPFLEEVVSDRGNSTLPWCVGGDFNVDRRMSERKGSRRISSQMHRFSSWIDELELIDLPLGGAFFTWSNMQENMSLARLDRFLIDSP